MNERPYWLGFSLVPGIGPKRLDLLAQAFGSLRAAWDASESRLRSAGLDSETTASLIKARAQINLEDEMAKVERVGAHLLTPDDEDYPAPLKHLPDPPLTLYVRGTLTPEDSQALAMVGTRRATHYGRDAATYFARRIERRWRREVAPLP